MAKKQFKTESKRILDLMINSIYTHREIFLRELISNASDASDKLYFTAMKEGNTGLNREDLPIHIGVDKENRVLTISDHGCGMTPEVQARIFEKFYQGDSSRKAMGNGLGLPLVKRIVELSDGVIEVDSAPGQGSTFRVILPKK